MPSALPRHPKTIFMKLIIGLGNPGKKYEQTRHNIGFLVIGELQRELNTPDFKLNKKFQAEISEININKEKIILAKPQTFMNESGKAIKLLKNFYKIPIKNIFVVRDDIDMELGKYREKKNSSSGGHNGINSIIKNLGSQSFTQIKIGIKNNSLEKLNPADFVLQNFTNQEKEKLKERVPQFIEKIKKLIK